MSQAGGLFLKMYVLKLLSKTIRNVKNLTKGQTSNFDTRLIFLIPTVVLP